MKKILQILDQHLIQFSQILSSGKILNRNYQTLAFATPAIVLIFILINWILPPFVKEQKNKNTNFIGITAAENNWWAGYDGESTSEEFWENAIPRKSDSHTAKLADWQNKKYWIGFKINSELAEEIKNKAYIYFYVGLIHGEHEIYINNKLVGSYGVDHISEPVVVDLKDSLQAFDYEKKDTILVSIKINHSLYEPHPDQLHISGFVSAALLQEQRKKTVFSDSILSSISLGFSLGLGFIFFSIWLCGVRKQEIAAFSAVALLQAVIESVYIAPVWIHMGALTWHRLNFVTAFYEAVLIFWLGFSLARIRTHILLIVFVILFITPWFIFSTDYKPGEIFHFVEHYIWGKSLTYSYFFVALVCFGQARLVSARYKRELNDAQRILKLHFSWIALLIMGLIQARLLVSGYDNRILNMMVLTLLASAVVQDYRRQDLLMRRSPPSKYHQRADLSQSVDCAMVSIDLKKSESLYQFGASHNMGAAYVVEIISKFYQKIIGLGGEVVQTEGDAIIFFFEKNNDDTLNQKIITLLTELHIILKTYVSEQVSKHENFPADIGFRAAVDFGSIRPVWQKFEGRDVPSWEQSGKSQIFVNLARLLEAEAKICSKEKSSVVFSSEYNLASPDKISNHDVEIKHGRVIKLSVLPLPSI